MKISEIQSSPVYLKCDTHDFACTDPAEWEDHLAKAEHIHEGVAPCNQCGNETNFKWKGKLGTHTTPALCAKCKQELLAGLQDG